MSEPPAPVAPESPAPATPEPSASATPVAQVRRPHPLSPVVQGWAAFLAFVAYVLKDFWRESGHPPLWFAGLLLIPVLVLSGVAAYLSWRFTRFVIDAREVRIESGWLQRTTKQVGTDRIQSVDVIQPLAARLLGLAEVRIDVGADSATRLRYLGRKDAYATRDLLMAHAHGAAVAATSAVVAPADDGRPASIDPVTGWNDVAGHEQVLITVPPKQIVAAALLSEEMLGSLVFLLATAVPAVVVAVLGGKAAFGSAFVTIPALFGLFKVVSDRLFGQYNYRLVRSRHGLKISRGLTSLTSQSVPVERIQGIRLHQGWLWRPLGLTRVDIDVLGMSHLTSDEDSAKPSTILLPAGTDAQVRTALAATLPELDLDALRFQHVPRSARWLEPLWWRGRAWAVDDRYVVVRHGLLGRSVEIVPHRRVQSLAFHQGPMSRHLGLATVEVHSTPGPVNLRLAHVDIATATRFLEEEPGRIRAALAAVAPPRQEIPARGTEAPPAQL